MAKSNLHAAMLAKNDEFYTKLEDIDAELSKHPEAYVNKWIYCPCDDYRWSNFYKYLKTNFTKYQLRHLTATNYDLGDGAFRADFNGFEEVVTPLEGDGSFQSPECTAIKNQADFIITNPPFSLFRDFWFWLQGGEFELTKGKWKRKKI